MKSLRKSIGVKLKEEAEFIEGEVVEIQIDHRKGDGMQLSNDHRDPLETDLDPTDVMSNGAASGFSGDN
nr:hypothetical protein [Tanacetum cinerariifolium]